MTEIFVVLAESLQVSFYSRHSNRAWALLEVASLPALIMDMNSGRVEKSELIVLLMVIALTPRW